MSVSNDAIITRAWLEGSNAFQQRIPNPETAGYARCVEELFSPLNKMECQKIRFQDSRRWLKRKTKPLQRS